MNDKGLLPNIHKIRYRSISCTMPIFFFVFPIFWLRHWIALIRGMRMSTNFFAAIALASVSVASWVAPG